MQYTFRDVFSKEIGIKKTKELFIKAGELAGTSFCKNVLDVSLPFEKFIAHLQDTLSKLKIGVLRIEESNLETMDFIITVSEDLDCSGLPLYGETVCDYDEGFLSGIFKTYTGKPFKVVEIDCWATGDRTCRFNVSRIEN